MDNYKYGEGAVTQCQCGRQIQLYDGGLMGLYWAHVVTDDFPRSLISCDPDDGHAWIKGDKFRAMPKEEAVVSQLQYYINNNDLTSPEEYQLRQQCSDADEYHDVVRVMKRIRAIAVERTSDGGS